MPQAGSQSGRSFVTDSTTLLFKSPRGISFPEAFLADIDIRSGGKTSLVMPLWPAASVPHGGHGAAGSSPAFPPL